MTTVVEPNLSRADLEKVFTDPETNTKLAFPSTVDSDPSVYISLVVPAYNEEERCKLACTISLVVLMSVSVCYSTSYDG